MKVNRFKNKALYKSKDKSIFHKFLKEEGYNRKFLSIDLDMSYCTIDNYLKNPRKFKVEHIKSISEETGVDANFIFDLIYENK